MRAPLSSLRTTVLHGVAWNAGYQALGALIQFVAMLVVVRVVPPAEYGLWAAAVGILQLVNIVNISSFVSHALQLREGEEPDWTLHWHAGNVLQGLLCVVCLGIGWALQNSSHYRGISTLLFIASVGLLVNTPAQIRTIMLQRRLDYRRLRLVATVSSLFGTAVIVIGAVAGLGARALILGGNVLGSLPYIVDLLLIERWRPAGRWFDWPDLSRYGASLWFGTNRAASALLGSSRGAVGAVVLPPTLGFGAIGLMNRAEGLFAMSAGRVLSLVSETVYPILPQLAAAHDRFERIARAYCLLMTAFALAAFALFVGCGRDLSRVLYGSKWTAADPLLIPGSLIGLGATLATVGGQILLAKGHLKDVFVLDLLPRVLLAPAFVGVLVLEWNVVAFHWGVAIPLAAFALVEIVQAGRRLPGANPFAPLIAPVIAAGAGWLGAVLIGWTAAHAAPVVRLGAEIPAFALVWLLVLRSAFPGTLKEMLQLLPGGARMQHVLRLDDAPAGSLAAP